MLRATITIEGNRAEGKTTLAIMLTRYLEEQGHTVLYEGVNQAANETVEELAESEEEVELERPTTITIVDRDTTE